METKNLSLLKVNPKTKIKHHDLNLIWNELLDYYYKNTSKKSWGKFLKDIDRKTKLESKLLLIDYALELIRLGDEEGILMLNRMNIKTDSLIDIKQGINRIKTSIDMLSAMQNKSETEEAVTFFDMLAKVELQIGYQIKIDDVSLDRWVSIIKILYEKHKAESEAINKMKNK